MHMRSMAGNWRLETLTLTVVYFPWLGWVGFSFGISFRLCFACDVERRRSEVVQEPGG
jgi:hypothetical protein